MVEKDKGKKTKKPCHFRKTFPARTNLDRSRGRSFGARLPATPKPCPRFFNEEKSVSCTRYRYHRRGDSANTDVIAKKTNSSSRPRTLVEKSWKIGAGYQKIITFVVIIKR